MDLKEGIEIRELAEERRDNLSRTVLRTREYKIEFLPSRVF